MSILQLNPVAAYAVGATFTLPRRSLAVSRETVSAKVEVARKGSNDWIYTLAIDDGGKYGHWRVMTEWQLRQRIAEAAQHTLPTAA